MYQVSNNIAYINGNRGIYDTKVNNPDVRYGRNAAANYSYYLFDYNQPSIQLPDLSNLSQLSQDEFDKKMSELDSALEKQEEYNKKVPPLKFNYQYSKNGLNIYSLLASSYEEMGRRIEIAPEALAPALPLKDNEVELDARVFDLNGDGKIDIAEYSTYTLVEDALDESEVVSSKNIDGVITNTGSNRAYAYQLAANAQLVKPILKNLYQEFDLGKAQEEFLSDKNNLIA